MPLNERDVTAATVAEVRAAGPRSRPGRCAARSRRLRLEGWARADEAVLIEKYSRCMDDAAAASSDAAAGEEKLAAAAVAAAPTATTRAMTCA